MAIARPVTKTIISTAQFGIPVADGLNANTDTLKGHAIYAFSKLVGGVAVPSNASVMQLSLDPATWVGAGVSNPGNGFTVSRAGTYLVMAQLLFGSSANQPAAGAIYLEGRCNVAGAIQLSSFMGPTGTYYALPMMGTIKCNANDVVIFQVSTNFTTTATDSRGAITLKWIGER